MEKKNNTPEDINVTNGNEKDKYDKPPIANANIISRLLFWYVFN